MREPDQGSSRPDRFRYEYGAEPLHLLATLASLGVAGYAILRIFEIPSTGGILLWLIGAIFLHDLIALPLYSLFLRVAEETAEAAVRPRRKALLLLNCVRIPVAFSLVMLLICFPLVFQLDRSRYALTTGLDLDRYLGNWLLLSAVLFLLSGLVYAVKLRGGRADRPIGQPPTRRPPPPTVGRATAIASRAVIAAGALLAIWVAALVVYGLVASFPI
jgi:hypothetical protein